MPVTPTYPGVYIEEIPSGVRTIAGVATSIAAFVDCFRRGLLNEPMQLFSMGDFDREFGGLDARSEASYGIHQFFLNGGTEAWAVRTASGNAAAASVEIQSAISGARALTVTAGRGKKDNPGTWGNDLRVGIDDPASGLDPWFNLTVSLVKRVNGEEAVVRTEVFRGLSMEPAATNFVDKIVNDEFSGSKLVRVEASGTARPLPAGTYSGTLSPSLALTAGQPQVSVTIGNEATATAKLAGKPVTLADARGLLESAIRAAKPESKAFAQASVAVVDNRLRILAGPTDAAARVTFAATPADATTVSELKLDAANAQANVQSYALGAGVAVAQTAQGAGTPGADGDPPDAAALIGDLNAKTGIYALEDVDLFNLLCLPRTAVRTGARALPADQAKSVMTAAINYCEQRRAFFLMDTPAGVDEVPEVQRFLQDNATLRHKNAALYFPRVQIADPLDGFKLRSSGASGTVAGLYARTDAARGVWKAPAGTEATLRGVQQLDYKLTDPETGTLNPLGINCLRNFPVYGSVCWGARTLDGSDQQASEWKYVPVRRTALFLEESLYRGTQWVVFEPNDEPLWAQIRLNIGAFLQNLFRQGAFQGKTPRDAYFVKCDRETTTQNDINLGIVNILVGFAPLKPAEFVVIKIQQMAGQIAT